MVVDSSVLIAILLQEPERRTFTERIHSAPYRFVSVASVLEIVIVYTKRMPSANPADVSEVLDLLLINPVPVTLDQSREAVRAFLRFGKGRHPAKLNFRGLLQLRFGENTG